jgi:hypothetical protein
MLMICIYVLAYLVAHGLARLDYTHSAHVSKGHNQTRFIGSVELRGDTVTFLDVVTGCSSMDFFYCPLGGFVLVGTNRGDLLLLSHHSTPVLEVSGPNGAGAVRVLRLVQAKSSTIQHQALLLAVYDDLPGIYGLLLDHRTMQTDFRGWLLLSEGIHDIVDVQAGQSSVHAGKLRLQSVVALTSDGDAYAAKDVVVDWVSWPFSLMRKQVAHIYASYKFGIFGVTIRDVEGNGTLGILERLGRNMDSATRLCGSMNFSGHALRDRIAFDDAFHEVYVSVVLDDGATLRRLRVAPGGCREIQSVGLPERVMQVTHVSSSGGYSLISGRDMHGYRLIQLYNHSSEPLKEATIPWEVERHLSLEATEDDLFGSGSGGSIFSCFIESIGRVLKNRAGSKANHEGHIALWGQVPLLQRNTIAVLSSSRRTLLLYRATFRSVIGGYRLDHSKEYAKSAIGIFKSVGLIIAGVIGLALSKDRGRAGSLSASRTHRKSYRLAYEYQKEIDARARSVFKSDKGNHRTWARRRVPTREAGPLSSSSNGALHQEAVDFAPEPTFKPQFLG